MRRSHPCAAQVLACQNIKGADFLLEQQYLHKALITVIAVQDGLVIAVVLNRPTGRKVTLRLEKGGDRVKTVAFGGDVQVRSAAGGVVWLKRGPLANGAGERLPFGPRDLDKATHVVGAKDVVDAIAAGRVDPDDILACSGVVAFPSEDFERLLGCGHLLPIHRESPLMEACWGLHADKAKTRLSPDEAWRAAYDSVEMPPATHAELRDSLASEALEHFRATFLS